MSINTESQYISGMGKHSVVPEEIKKWNWGAVLFNWIWGIGNSTYIALLMFVPLINIVMIFMLGAKGSEWAWRNRTWRDVEHFKSTQKAWRNAGFALVLVVVPLIFIMLSNLMKGEAYDLSVDAIKSNRQVISIVGNNPNPGLLVLGEVSYGGSGGTANLNYEISGSKGSADVYVYATSLGNKWELKKVLVVSKTTSEKVIVLDLSD